jgi:putative flavoprotein involved in K+ transport
VAERVDTIVVGAGQAGLSTSYHLTRRGREHVVLERGQIAHTWRTKRWDGFYLNTPKWTQQLPGHEYRGPEPDAFASLDEAIAYIDEYAAAISAPVRTGVAVSSIRVAGGMLEVEANEEVLYAQDVVVATGAYPEPTPTRLAAAVSDDVFQLHTSEYRNPDQLPAGAILIVGGGQSGCQIADELIRAGRRIHLSVGRCPWIPRRYRDREIVRWLVDTGFTDQTVDTLPSPAARLACNPPVSGNDGGHDCHPRWLEARGAILLGRLLDVRDHTVVVAPDLEESLAFGEHVRMDLLAMIDGYIAEHGLDSPEDEPSDPPPRIRPIEELDLREAGITTILWSNGYRPAFHWIDVALFDEYGWPIQDRGVTACPGLYFVGLHWLHKRKSSLLFGVGEDAEHVVSHIAGRGTRS